MVAWFLIHRKEVSLPLPHRVFQGVRGETDKKKTQFWIDSCLHRHFCGCRIAFGAVEPSLDFINNNSLPGINMVICSRCLFLYLDLNDDSWTGKREVGELELMIKFPSNPSNSLIPWSCNHFPWIQCSCVTEERHNLPAVHKRSGLMHIF